MIIQQQEILSQVEILSSTQVYLYSTTDYCPLLSNPTSGSITYSTSANTNSNYQSGTVATHDCSSGFSVVGDATRTCMDGEGSGMGVWSGTAPTCERKLKLVFTIIVTENHNNNTPAYKHNHILL